MKLEVQQREITSVGLFLCDGLTPIQVADVKNSDGLTPIQVADVKNRDGLTPIQVADVKNSDGLTPIQVADERGPLRNECVWHTCHTHVVTRPSSHRWVCSITLGTTYMRSVRSISNT